MRGLRLERPPRWGILTLILLIAGNIALFTVMGMRPAPADTYESQVDPAGAASPTDLSVPSSTEASLATPSEDPAVPPVLAVYGDGYAAGNELGGVGAAGWPALVAGGTGSEVVLNAVPQAGYASVGASGQNYVALVRSNPVPDAAVIVLFGSRNDADEDLAVVQANVTQALDTARANSPSTTLVVVGPAWDDAAVPASVLAVRDIVQSAAATAGAVFVDPIAGGWFAEQQPGLIAADGVSPTDAGHAYMAERLIPVVAGALTTPGLQPGA